MNRSVVPVVMVAVASTAVAAETPEHRLKVEFDELAAKATAAIETVNGMEQRAKANGQALHPDLIAQRILVQTAMDDAEEALRAKDLDALRERLKRARSHIERLYSML
jgi:hypothetical protein